MPYDIVEEDGEWAVYRLPYEGETGSRRKVATAGSKKDAGLYVAFADKKIKKKGSDGRGHSDIS